MVIRALTSVDGSAYATTEAERKFRGAHHGGRQPSEFRLRAVRGRGEGHEPVPAVGADRRIEARLVLRAGALELFRGAAAASARLRPDHHERSRAPRAVPGESDTARHHLHLRFAV